MKIAIAQINPIVGDLEYNYNKHIEYIDKAIHNSCDLIIFPELSMCGYPPLDLLEDDHFIGDIEEHVKNLALKYEHNNINIIVGGAYIPEEEGRIQNCALHLYAGLVYHTVGKQLLPTYNIFDEQRYFNPGSGYWNKCLMDIGDEKDNNRINVGILICEDIWAEEDNRYMYNPIEQLFRGNGKVDFIISINASPSNIGKQSYREEMLSRLSKKYDTTIIYVNQVGANDDLIFDGNSMVYDKGVCKMQLGEFIEDYEVIKINDNGNVEIDITGNGLFASPTYMTRNKLENKSKLYYNHIILGIRDYCNKLGFKKVVIGESGGIDSALVTALAVDALGSDNVIAITMPSEYSSKGSWADSEILCNNLGVKLYDIEIKELFDQYKYGYNLYINKINNNLTSENLQARIRANILMMYSNDNNALLLSTSNKSESSVGYTTYLGDMSGGLAPISDIYKTEVWELSK